MSITHVSEREMQLVNQLRFANDVLEFVAAERDAEIERLKQVTAERDKLAGELKALRDSGVELPEPSIKLHGKHKNGNLSKESMGMFMEAELRDYGDRRAMAERERCAQVCIGIANKPSNVILGTAIECAEAIRKGEK